MAKAKAKPLKSQNVPWLWSVVVLDCLFILLIAYPSPIEITKAPGVVLIRASFSAAAPVVVLLLSSLLPSGWKDILIFWRFRETLPGHRAFSVHAANDSRIDLDALKKNVGEFPLVAREQNTKWYQLYKKVESEVSVSLAHRHYLLFRDLAALSLLLASISFPVLYFLDVKLTLVWVAFAMLLVQYLMTAIAARNNGIRFVTNVLAIHATQKYA